jgi:hypothetical protein
VIIGLGEPTLWNNLEEGLSLFFKHSADVTNKVSLVTNGYDLDRLAPFIGKGLDTVYLSLYPETYDFLIDKGTEFKNEYPNNFVFNYEGCRALFGDDNMLSNFFVYTDPKRKIQFDGECECPGPMYNDGYIYPLCGKAVSVSLFESHPYIRKAPFVNYLAGTYFLDSDNEKAICTIPACNYCRCNTGGYAGKQPLVAPHRMSGVVSES